MQDRYICTPEEYIDKAEFLLSTLFRNSKTLSVWRMKKIWHFSNDGMPDRSVDTVFVGLCDKNNFQEPIGQVFLTTYLDSSKMYAEIRIFLSENRYEERNVPFGGGWFPLRELANEGIGILHSQCNV